MDQTRIALADFVLAAFQYTADVITGHLVLPAITKSVENQTLLAFVRMVFLAVTFVLSPYFLRQGSDPVLLSELCKKVTLNVS